MSEAVTPEPAAVDAPVSMDSIIEEIASGNQAEGDNLSEVVEELEGGQADEAARPEEDTTEAVENDEETAEAEPEAEDAPEPTYKVKVNGEEVEVPLSELTKGYSRERDYTAKTMALAEERKALQSKFASELQQQVEIFEALDPILSEARNIDWQALAASDPATYVQLKEAVDSRRAAVDQARARIAQASQGNPEAEAAAKAEEAQRETEALIKAVPELAEPEKLTAFAKSNVDFLIERGFEAAEIADLLDHRALQIIDDARKYREMKKSEAELPQKKVVPKPKAKALKSDNPDSSRPAKRLSANANYDQRMAHVLNELTQGS